MLSAAASLEPVQDSFTADGSKPVVLVVDPDQSARSVLEVVLAREGFNVWSTHSGAEGLALIARGRAPDVVVLESELGPEDGFSLCAQLRGDAKTAEVPVLLLAKADKGNAELAEIVGVDDFVQKPVFARDVAALVRLELARRSTQGPVTFHAAQLSPLHLLRAVLAGPRSGRMTLAEGRATVTFRHGRVIDAKLNGEWGLEALSRAVMLTQGEWTVSLEPVVGPPEFHCTLREVVSLVVPRAAKWDQARERGVALDARLQVDFGRLASALSSLPDEVNHLVRLFDGRRTVRQVLMDSTLEVALALQAATRLHELGVLVPVEAAVEALELRPMPKLFEPRASEAEERMQQLFAGAATDDWYEPWDAAQDLEVAASDAGWKLEPVTTAAGHLGLEPALDRQLEAFRIPTQVEPRQDTAAEKLVTAFALGAEEPSAALEDAVRSATAEEQSRIITPTLVPVTSPSLSEFEATFFAQEPAEETETTFAPSRSSSRLALYVGGAAVVMLVAVALELLIAHPSQSAPAKAEPIVVAPAPVVTAPQPAAIVEELAPEPTVDVTEPLNDGIRLYQSGEFSKAARTLEQVVTDDPKSVRGWLFLALARYDGLDNAGARDAVDQTLALDPQNAQAYVLTAALFQDSGDLAAARAALEHVLELEPKGPTADEAKAILARTR